MGAGWGFCCGIKRRKAMSWPPNMDRNGLGGVPENGRVPVIDRVLRARDATSGIFR